MNHKLICRILFIANRVLLISAIILDVICILILLHIVPVGKNDKLYLYFSFGLIFLASILNIVRIRIKGNKENG
ncbi:MAG: hypothetical protein K2H31_11840 [Lachnospiraceae bacterium]|nr:hypothetical protein [Lachnospiraceae bacterium]